MDDARIGPGGWSDDETRPLDLARLRPVGTDPEPVVAEALAVVERSLAEMAGRATRPLLDAPSRPYRLRPLGGTGLAVFPVVLDVSRVADAPDRTVAHRVLDAYAAAGGNALVVDDAADGRGAQSVGAWLANRRRREPTVLAARVGGAAGLSAAGLQAAVERLLRRLGVARIDLLILAGHESAVPLEETLTAAAGLVDADRVGHVVAGSHSADRLMQARITAGQRALPLFAGVAPVYSLLDRGYESGVAGVAHAQGLACLPMSPLADGLLAAGAPNRAALRRLRELEPDRAERLQRTMTRRALRTVDAVAAIATRREVPPAAVALGWLLTRPLVTAPIVSVRDVAEVWAATAAAGVHLSRSEVAALDRASAE